MLILATAALAEVPAGRFDPLRSRGNNPEELGARESLLQLRHFRLDHFAHGHERNEDDEIFHARHPFAPEGNVANRQGQLVAQSQSHAENAEELSFLSVDPVMAALVLLD